MTADTFWKSSASARDWPPGSAATTQISAALNYAGAVKAFHYHLAPDGLLGARQGPASGGARGSPNRLGHLWAAQYNLRGSYAPVAILIPPGVAHGYKVVGHDDAMLVYLTDRFYNPQDEGRIPYNDPSINYDWETQKK